MYSLNVFRLLTLTNQSSRVPKNVTFLSNAVRHEHVTYENSSSREIINTNPQQQASLDEPPARSPRITKR